VNIWRRMHLVVRVWHVDMYANGSWCGGSSRVSGSSWHDHAGCHPIKHRQHQTVIGEVVWRLDGRIPRDRYFCHQYVGINHSEQFDISICTSHHGPTIKVRTIPRKAPDSTSTQCLYRYRCAAQQRIDMKQNIYNSIVYTTKNLKTLWWWQW